MRGSGDKKEWIEIRVSLDMFLSAVKLSRGFYVFIYLSTLSRHTTDMYREAKRVCLCTRLTDRVRALPIGSRVLL